MPRAIDVAYVMYQVPNLKPMESFLADFGLAVVESSDDALYMRAAGPEPFVHATLRGPETRFLGAGLTVSSRAELEDLASLAGSSPVQALGTPGGGFRVRMTTPDNVQIDAVWGRTPAKPLSLRPPNPFNAGGRKSRFNSSLRPKREAGQALRLGHFVLRVSDHDTSVAWFRQRFDLQPSDYMCVPGDGGRVFGTFLRCGRGADYVDHHAMLVVEAAETGIHHCSFELQDLDAIMGAHDHLSSRGYRLDCGVGRHLIGSQIFDYWRDPYGFRVEHYTDGDVVNDEYVPVRYTEAADETTQWGMDPPREFFE
jgi:hypothetical protein